MVEAVETFTVVTGATEPVARRYLEMTENDAQQAIALYFDSPDLASGVDASPPAPSVPTSTRPRGTGTSVGHPTSGGVVHLDSDDEDTDIPDFEEDDPAVSAAAIGRSADYEDDEAMARRIQEELFAGGDVAGGVDADGVRAPIARTTETLVGGSDGGWGHNDIEAAIAQQMRMRQPNHTPASRAGVFNQRPVSSSIWDESSNLETRREGLSRATGGASEASTKTARLAELYRPPFDLMNQIPWDAARDKGKEELKWILVNIQDPSIFDCQQLNRDIWKNQGIKELVRENFIFMQYSKDDPRGDQYIRLYFELRDSEDAYPHIAIVDPRTGEQVKVWSGPPVPKPGDFLMELVEFLDRYSLDRTKKNPVAKWKPEKPKSVDVGRLTEEEMLDLAMKNSLDNGDACGPKGADQDELTKSSGNANKGKGKEVDDSNSPTAMQTEPPTTYSQIAQSNPHVEPAAGPGITRIQFRHSDGRIVRRFVEGDRVERLYEWLKADPLEDKTGVPFDLRSMGKDLGDHLNDTIATAGLKNGTVMIEYLEE
ncbi:hypothetical protein BJ875DRAFT_499759 [Amylocarpus encephaloides]|uniref:UAS domain-containing protein n=1 Tax=Amylocarpus encephaloides TaxID=45428 RepID=A0A9P7YAD3_9HELO|nr:hypothetical protein BJ875DRAFT_499759 [Amylocarpus encephaloides]